jgi:curved DNA-binding protein CbpA
MSNPWEVLGLAENCDDDTIRRRYLELVRQYPPERNPDRFAAIRQAYDSTRDLTTRLHYRLFESGKKDTVDAIIEELTCRNQRRRVPLEALLSILGPD